MVRFEDLLKIKDEEILEELPTAEQRECCDEYLEDLYESIEGYFKDFTDSLKDAVGDRDADDAQYLIKKLEKLSNVLQDANEAYDAINGKECDLSTLIAEVAGVENSFEFFRRNYLRF